MARKALTITAGAVGIVLGLVAVLLAIGFAVITGGGRDVGSGDRAYQSRASMLVVNTDAFGTAPRFTRQPRQVSAHIHVHSTVPMFLGVAPTRNVDLGLLGAFSYDLAESFTIQPYRLETHFLPLDTDPGSTEAPARMTLWTARASGTDAILDFTVPTGGGYRLVVMRADGKPGIDTAINFREKATGLRGPIIAATAVGLLLLAGSVFLLVRGIRRNVPPRPQPPDLTGYVPPPAPAPPDPAVRQPTQQ